MVGTYLTEIGNGMKWMYGNFDATERIMVKLGALCMTLGLVSELSAFIGLMGLSTATGFLSLFVLLFAVAIPTINVLMN